jgi:hypothetical protein
MRRIHPHTQEQEEAILLAVAKAAEVIIRAAHKKGILLDVRLDGSALLPSSPGPEPPPEAQEVFRDAA